MSLKQLDAPPTGVELKEIRLAYGLSQRALGEMLGVSLTTIQLYEAGRYRVPQARLEKINRLLSSPPPPAAVSAEELKALRKARGLTMAQLADSLGIKRSTYRNYESGNSPVQRGLAERIVSLFPESPSPEEFRELRHSLHLTQRQLAKALGLRLRTIWEYENGRKPIPCDLPARIHELSSGEGISEILEPVMTAEEFRGYRRLKRLTRRQFIDMLGISSTTLTAYEKGKHKVPKRIAEKIKEMYPDVDIAAYLAHLHEQDASPDHVPSPGELRSLRRSRGLSQRELGAALGVGMTEISLYENGRIKIPNDLIPRILVLFPDEIGPEMSGEELKEIRMQLGLSQREFARRFGSDATSISQIERGKKRTPAWLAGRISQEISENE